MGLTAPMCCSAVASLARSCGELRSYGHRVHHGRTMTARHHVINNKDKIFCASPRSRGAWRRWRTRLLTVFAPPRSLLRGSRPSAARLAHAWTSGNSLALGGRSGCTNPYEQLFLLTPLHRFLMYTLGSTGAALVGSGPGPRRNQKAFLRAALRGGGQSAAPTDRTAAAVAAPTACPGSPGAALSLFFFSSRCWPPSVQHAAV